MPVNSSSIKSGAELLKQDASGLITFGGARMALLDLESGFYWLRRQIEGLAGEGLTSAVLQQAGAQGGSSFARSFIKTLDVEDVPGLFRECLASYQAAGFGEFEIEVLDWENNRIRVRAVQAFEAWVNNKRGKPAENPVCAYTAGVLVGFLNVLEGGHDLVCIEHVCQAQGAKTCLFELLPAKDVGEIPAVTYAPDPSLGSQLNLLEVLFARMPMSIAIFDSSLNLKRCNPTWVTMIERYTASHASKSSPGIHLYDLIPGVEKIAQPLIDRVLQGETVNVEANLLESGGIVSYWDMTLAPLKENGEVVGFIDVSIDATERVRSEQALRESQRLLEQRVEERTQDLFTVLEVSQTVASTLDLPSLMKLVLEQLQSVVDYDGASVMVLEGDQLKILSYQGPIPQEKALEIKFPLELAAVNKQVIQNREPVIVPDVYDDTPLAEALRRTAGEELYTTFSYMKSWMGVPLIVRDQVIGMISLDHHKRNHFTPPQDKLLMAFANQVAVAVENARLYNEEQEQRRQAEQRRKIAEGLRDILKTLNSDRSLEEILEAIVSQASQLLGSKAVVIYRIDEGRDTFVVEAAYNMPDAFMEIGELPLILSESNRAILDKQPFAIDNLEARIKRFQHMLPHLPESIQDVYKIIKGIYNAELSVPLIIRDEVYGAISLYYENPRRYSEEDIALAVSFADQAALAIENARLRSQAARAAVQSERSRLARDLHDAVTQTLFSASLIAEVLPRLWEKNRAEGHKRLGELRELTRGALAEMRTLLLELRPAALIEAEPAELFRHLVEAFNGRARIPVDFKMEGEGELPPEVKVAFYRIAQEALNNTAKHAEATRVELNVECGQNRINLDIRDDGLGFDMAGLSHESLGLGIMKERAENIGAILSIYSEVGKGTQITVTWKKPERSARNNK